MRSALDTFAFIEALIYKAGKSLRLMTVLILFSLIDHKSILQT